MLKPYKTHFILTLCLIVMLMLVPVAQAAPPAPGSSSDGSSLGDSLNLDENGNPVDEGGDTGGNNLGTVMSDKSGDAVDDSTTDDGTIDDGTGDGTTDDGTTGDNTGDDTTDDGTTDDGTTGEVTNQHPVATALAEYFDVDYNEIMTLHEEGNGFGNIAKAYFFADQLGLTPQDLLLEAHTSGWGNVLKQNGIHPGAVGKGGGKKSEVTEQPENSPIEPQNNGAAGLTGPGGQNGNGHGNGNGGGNGHGHGNDNGGGKGHGGGNGNGHGNK